MGGRRAGSAGYVYALDAAGMRLTESARSRTARPWPVGRPFLAHSLEVTSLYVQLVEQERTQHLSVQAFTTEPACWRAFYGPGGGRVILKPDAFASLRLGSYEDSWFIEVDRGTESLPTIARKCDLYRQYWQSGTEQARTQVFPRVLWVATNSVRAEALIDLCGRQPAEAWRLFTVATVVDAVGQLAQGAAT